MYPHYLLIQSTGLQSSPRWTPSMSLPNLKPEIQQSVHCSLCRMQSVISFFSSLYEAYQTSFSFLKHTEIFTNTNTRTVPPYPTVTRDSPSLQKTNKHHLLDFSFSAFSAVSFVQVSICGPSFESLGRSKRRGRLQSHNSNTNIYLKIKGETPMNMLNKYDSKYMKLWQQRQSQQQIHE